MNKTHAQHGPGPRPLHVEEKLCFQPHETDALSLVSRRPLDAKNKDTHGSSRPPTSSHLKSSDRGTPGQRSLSLVGAFRHLGDGFIRAVREEGRVPPVAGAGIASFETGNPSRRHDLPRNICLEYLFGELVVCTARQVKTKISEAPFVRSGRFKPPCKQRRSTPVSRVKSCKHNNSKINNKNYINHFSF